MLAPTMYDEVGILPHKSENYLWEEQIFKQERVIDLGKGKLGILQSVAMSHSALSHLFPFSATVVLEGLASGAVSPYRC